MKTPRFVRTISFRLTALYAGLFATSTVLLFGFVYWIAIGSLYDQLRLSLQSEMASLEAKLPGAEAGVLAAEIDQRLASRAARQFLYNLTDPSGRRVAGNLASGARFEGWQALSYDDEGEPSDEPFEDEADHKLLALGRSLPDGSQLIVGADLSRLIKAEESMLTAFAWATGVTLLLGLTGGFALSQGFLQRIDTINRTAHAIMRGDLSERIQTRGTGDELDQLGRNLNDMLDRLHGLMEGLRQVSNDIAHDLRTPLSRLKQRLEAVRGEASSMEDYKQAVDQALADADVALATFGALLRIAQIESGARRAKFAYLDLSALMTNLAMTYAAVAEDSGKQLAWTIDPALHIRGDRELLTQAFVNLIENALRHTPPGSQIAVSLKREGGQTVAVISDNGPGIPVEERKNVFRRFYRLEASRSTPGSGLGLALVAAIAHLHGAEVLLGDNGPGVKATLRFKSESGE